MAQISSKHKIAKPHPIFAAFCDFYFLATVTMIVLAILSLAFDKIFYTTEVSIMLSIIFITAIILYHSYFYNKSSCLSVGEHIAGKTFSNGAKKWINPYFKNRWLFFLIAILSLLLTGSEWNSLGVSVMPLAMVIGKVIRIFLVFFGIYLIGRGKVLGALLPLFVFFISAIFIYLAIRSADTSNAAEIWIIFFINVVLALGYLLIMIFYKKQK